MKRKMTVLVASTMLAITSASLPASAEPNPTGQTLAAQMSTEKGVEESQLATFGQADDINHFPDNTNHFRNKRTKR